MTTNPEPRNWANLKPGEPLYTCKINPHAGMEAVKDAKSKSVLWRCVECGTEAEYEELRSIPCPIISPPCLHCGQTPICAWDCKGIWSILRDPRVYLAGGQP